MKPSASVALHRHSNALVDILPPEVDSSISMLSDDQKPDVTYQVAQFLEEEKELFRILVDWIFKNKRFVKLWNCH